jgi:hypothetical protein
MPIGLNSKYRSQRQHQAKSGKFPTGDEKMKTTGTLSAKNIFGMIAAASFLTIASSAAAVAFPFGFQAAPSAQPAFEHCGCDNKQGIEMYVQNLITDSQQRGMTCDVSMHIPACIVSYCSICSGHPGVMESCIKAGTDYLASSVGFCAPQNMQLTAYSVPSF